METFWNSVVSDLVSGVIYSAIISGLVIVFAGLFVERERRRLFSFFSIDNSESKLRIYLSRIDVHSGGTDGTDGPTRVGFVGPALDQMEYTGALKIKELFSSRLVESIPKIIRRFIQTRGNSLCEVNVEINAAPDGPGSTQILSTIPSGMVLIGSDVYSRLARAVFKSNETLVHFVSEHSGEPYHSGSSEHRDATFSVCTDDDKNPWQIISRESGSKHIGIIQRVSLFGNKPLIMCAGNSSTSTLRATLELCNNWKTYDDEFKDDDFLVVLEVKGVAEGSPMEGTVTELKAFRRRRNPTS